MIIVISPAKTLDFKTLANIQKYTSPEFLDHSAELIEQLKEIEPDKLGQLMSISPKLATLNSNRYFDWSIPFTPDNAKQCLLAFKGDVYTGLDAESLNPSEVTFAQKHLRILSGLYGVLRPLDLIQPYRLEMGTQLANQRGKDLYQFWGNLITDSINQDLKKQKDETLINLASNEYFKSVNTKQLKAKVITPIFKDQKNGTYKIISFFAKKARGLMSRYIIQNKLTNPEDIKEFNLAGYYFDSHASTQDEWLFKRDSTAA